MCAFCCWFLSLLLIWFLMVFYFLAVFSVVSFATFLFCFLNNSYSFPIRLLFPIPGFPTLGPNGFLLEFPICFLI